MRRFSNRFSWVDIQNTKLHEHILIVDNYWITPIRHELGAFEYLLIWMGSQMPMPKPSVLRARLVCRIQCRFDYFDTPKSGFGLNICYFLKSHSNDCNFGTTRWILKFNPGKWSCGCVLSIAAIQITKYIWNPWNMLMNKIEKWNWTENIIKK